MDENNNLNTKMIRSNNFISLLRGKKNWNNCGETRRRFQIFLEIIIVLINAYLLIQIGNNIKEKIDKQFIIITAWTHESNSKIHTSTR